MSERRRVSDPIRLRKIIKRELKTIGKDLQRRLNFKNELSYDEIIDILILKWMQGCNRGGNRLKRANGIEDRGGKE